MIVRCLSKGLLGVLVLLSACSSPAKLREQADLWAASAGMKPVLVQTQSFRLQSYQKLTQANTEVRVYIEGDGNAFLSRGQVSPDPTPKEPVGLWLAMRDPSPNVVYLARPCQFTLTDPRCCEESPWTRARFSETTVAATDEAIGRLGNRPVALVGYSGGGTIALLIAQRRTNISSIRTVAGNLDPLGFITHHKVSPLTGSLDPLPKAAMLAKIPQLHFSGGKDTIVPSALAENYLAYLPQNHCARLEILPEQNHHDGWESRWAGLLATPLPCDKTALHNRLSMQ